MNNLETWKYLQKNGYFENHRKYKGFQLAEEDQKFIGEIFNKTMVEIGCGYGRETCYFSRFVKKIHVIEVSNYILNQANDFIEDYGNISTVSFHLVDNYKNSIQEPVDYVYARHVFQHITPEIAKDYLKYFKDLLTPGGKIDILLRIGTKKNYPKRKEPLVEYTPKEVNQLFEGYTIYNLEKQKDKKYELWRVRANVSQSL